MDADCSHRPIFIEEFWRQRHAAEMLIASRYVAGGQADMGVVRRLLSHVLNRTYARALSLDLRDLSSGFRLYRRAVLNNLTVTARDFDILQEILLRVHAQGWRIREVPFHYTARGAGRSLRADRRLRVGVPHHAAPDVAPPQLRGGRRL